MPLSLHTLRRLTPCDVDAFRSLRLTALLESPTAFSATVAGEQALSDDQIATRMTGHSHSAIWGAWNAHHLLVGSVGLLHLPQEKLRHKASLYAVYVAPSARGTGLGRQLLKAAIAYARGVAQLRQLYLGVTAGNAAALALYESLGFVVYGCEPAALLVDDRYHDELLLQLRLQA